MNKEVKEIADDLISKGKKVFVNEKNEIFTEESLAQLSGSKFSEYTNSNALATDAGTAPKEKSLAKMNKEELQAKATEVGVELTEGESNKDLATKIQTKLDEIALAEEEAKKATQGE